VRKCSCRDIERLLHLLPRSLMDVAGPVAAPCLRERGPARAGGTLAMRNSARGEASKGQGRRREAPHSAGCLGRRPRRCCDPRDASARHGRCRAGRPLPRPGACCDSCRRAGAGVLGLRLSWRPALEAPNVDAAVTERAERADYVRVAEVEGAVKVRSIRGHLLADGWGGLRLRLCWHGGAAHGIPGPALRCSLQRTRAGPVRWALQACLRTCVARRACRPGHMHTNLRARAAAEHTHVLPVSRHCWFTVRAW